MNVNAFLSQPKPLLNPHAEVAFDFTGGFWMIDYRNPMFCHARVVTAPYAIAFEVMRAIGQSTESMRDKLIDAINPLLTKLLNQAVTDAIKATQTAQLPPTAEWIIGVGQRVKEQGWYWYVSTGTQSEQYPFVGAVHKDAGASFCQGNVYTKLNNPPPPTDLFPPKPADVVTTIGHTLYLTDDNILTWVRNDELTGVPNYWKKVTPPKTGNA